MINLNTLLYFERYTNPPTETATHSDSQLLHFNSLFLYRLKRGTSLSEAGVWWNFHLNSTDKRKARTTPALLWESSAKALLPFPGRVKGLTNCEGGGWRSGSTREGGGASSEVGEEGVINWFCFFFVCGVFIVKKRNWTDLLWVWE